MKFHKTTFILIFLCLSTLTQLWSQTTANLFVIKGTIIDAVEKTGIPFCNVGINGKAIGTLSNENGDFEFKIKKEHLQDTIYVNALGYQPSLYPVETLNLSNNQAFELEPSAIQIGEVTISAIPTMKILDRALSNIPKNYPTNSYLSEGFYREYITENGACRRLIEASLNILEKGYTDKRSVKLKQNVYINEIKQTHDYRNLRGYKWDGLQYLMNENIRGINPGGVINTYPLKDWTFTNDEITTVNGEQVHVVQFKPANEGLARPEGTLYIATDDYAIIQLEYAIKTGLEKWQTLRVSDTTRLKYYQWTITFSYKRFDNKLYLNSMRHNRNFKLQHVYIDEEYADVHIHNELYINDVNKKNINLISKEQKGDYNYLLSRNLPYNQAHWDAFNIPPPTEELKKMYEEINYLSQRERKIMVEFLNEREKHAPQ